MDRMAKIAKAAKKKVKVNENTMNSKAKEKLNEVPGVICHKYHGSSFSQSGHSDLYGSINGMAFYIEGKTGTKKPTELQKAFLEKARQENCIVGVYYTPDEAVRIVTEGYYAKLDEMYPKGE